MKIGTGSKVGKNGGFTLLKGHSRPVLQPFSQNLFGWRLLLLPLLFGQGCSMINHKVEHDPLRGDISTPMGPNGQTTLAHESGNENRSNGGNTTQTAALPSLPPAMLNLTPATLASGVNQTVNPNSPYVLASNNQNSRTGFESAGGTTAQGNPISLTGDIIPDVPSSSDPNINPPSTPDNLSANAAAWEQANNALKNRSILWRKGPTPVAGSPDSYSFSCAVPVPGNPSESIVYEKIAAGEGGLAVIRAVIADIDKGASR